ncbi:MAG TPA: hypothetical protein DEV85_10660 [Vibrio sp.]|uniref:hypothetical protein n=1 Tax=Vibrio sp. TaxID=678 RepID=UPI000EC81399|nr:hypothetical protein [Vibrio sp.]HCH02331.1 hypothetical protein [Vibrio sp.]
MDTFTLMQEANSKWIKFINETTDYDVELVNCVVDTEHNHKFTSGKWHIYSFWLNDSGESLKIGIAGPKSAARFFSQHYNENSTNSNLAKSLLKSNFCSSNAKGWIINNTYRVNVVFNDFNKPLAHALETHLHLLFNPIFEK